MENPEYKIRRFFQNIPGVIAVFVYGSYASGKTHSRSDVDIAILCDPDNSPSFFETQEMQTELSIRLRKEVDLVCLNEASPILQKQVISKGKRLLVRDQRRLNHFIIRLLTDYVDFKITRRPIEKGVLTRRILHD